jgi:hypothetical protein
MDYEHQCSTCPRTNACQNHRRPGGAQSRLHHVPIDLLRCCESFLLPLRPSALPGSGALGRFGFNCAAPSRRIGSHGPGRSSGPFVQIGFQVRCGFLSRGDLTFRDETPAPYPFSVSTRFLGRGLLDVGGCALHLGCRLQLFRIFERRVLSFREVI